MKRIALALLLSLLLLQPATAGPPADRIHVIADGTYIGCDVPPLLEEDRVLVPFRRLAEFYGWEVHYQPEDQSITARSRKGTVSMQVGHEEARVDGNAVPLDVPPRIVGGRTLVPLRFVAEALGATVAWKDTTRTVLVEGAGPEPQPLPPLQAAEILAVERLLSRPERYSNRTYVVFDGSTPAGREMIARLAAAWQDAIPAIHPDMMVPMPPYGIGVGARLESDGGAGAHMAWRCETSPDGGRGCGNNEDGFVYLQRNGGDPVLVYAPALADLIENYPLAEQP